MKEYNYMKISLKGFVPALLTAAIFSSCMNDNLGDNPNYSSSNPTLNFSATVLEGSDDADTRALTQTPFNIEAAAFPGNFYIEIWDPSLPFSDDGDSQDPPVDPGDDGIPLSKENPQIETYFVPTGGNGGMLQFQGEKIDTPNWCNIDDDHYFWSWTVPWEDPEPQEPDNGDNGNSGDSGNTGETPPDNPGTRDDENSGNVESEYVPTYEPIKVTLKDTYMDQYEYVDSKWVPKEDCWENGRVLEQFIGAKSGPYDFRHNGPEVPLQFHHLVSKISLRSLMFYGSDGSEHDEFSADIMFINMPTEFTFYPHPNHTDEEGKIIEETKVDGVEKDGAPIVVTNFDSADPNGGLMFAFTNPTPLPEETMPWDDQSELRDQFYICPDIDFSKVQYKVTLYQVADKYVNRGEYWGDFSSIVFERAPGTDYDNPKDPDNPDSYVDDSRILHAGEVMYFDLIVKQSGGGGTSIVVDVWRNRTRPALHYPHPGAYTDGQIKDLAGTSMTWAAKYELYGDGFFDGQNTPATPNYATGHLGVFHVYGDVSVGNTTTMSGDANYVIDGMGYNVTFEPTSTTETVVTIPKMIDVYITINGYSIYIDSEGNVFQYNESTNSYMPTGSQIDLTSNKATYKI
ncbi:MAG: hypothetical protein J1E82_03895, partial [Muribaculaceae bacterium]|nr:hypothetical protein [Muribaculaceae bacterium]